MCVCKFLETDYFSNLSIAIIGAFISILGSLFIFRKTIKKDKEKEEQKNKDYLAKRLKWTSELLKDVLTQANNQTDKYIEQGNKILTNPYTYHLVQILASNQWNRLQQIDSQELFEAFLDWFGDNPDTVKKYKEFLSKIDFISKSLDMTFESNERNINSIAIDQENLRIRIDNFYTNFLSLKNDIRTDPEVEVIMLNYWVKFQDYIGTGEADLQKMFNLFFVPLFTEIKDISENNNVSSGHIIVPLRDITTLMHHIESNNTNYAKTDALALKESLKESIHSLDALSKEIDSKKK